MKIAGLLICLCAISAVLNGQPGSSSSGMVSSARSEWIHPTMILWDTGLVETITPAMLGNHKIWRITHYPQDPTDTNINDYDLYDLDQKTLAPLRSVRNTEEYRLEITFAEKEVIFRKSTAKETTTEQIPLSTSVQPEGPGLDLFVTGLPLTVGYKTQYVIVDRWSGHGSSRLKNMILSVSKKVTEHTFLGQRSVYEVLIKPEDDSFQIREEVLAQKPHFPVSVEYTREGKTYPMSRVIAVAAHL